MNIIMDTIGEINPSQTPVDVCDQLIYALTKQLQWRFPSHFRKYFCLFGGVHVEKRLLVLHSDFIKGSGLPEVLGLSNLSVCSLENTMLFVNDIKGARYALQVSAAQYIKNLKHHIHVQILIYQSGIG